MTHTGTYFQQATYYFAHTAPADIEHFTIVVVSNKKVISSLEICGSVQVRSFRIGILHLNAISIATRALKYVSTIRTLSSTI